MNNKNIIIKDDFSSEQTKNIYLSKFNNNEKSLELYNYGYQCGGCSFFAPLNEDYGICCFKKSIHFTETVFEHFTCSNFIQEGWGAHSFSEDESMHCKCVE